MGSNICDVRKKWLIVWIPTPSPAKWNSRYLKTKKYANMWHILRPPPARSALPCEHHKYIVPYMFAVIWIFLFQKKIRSCCFKDTSQNSKHCLKTLISHNIQSNWHNGWYTYYGILHDRMPLMSTQVHKSYIYTGIYWYAQKIWAWHCYPLRNVFLFAHVFLFFRVFLLSIMSIFRSVF